MLPSAKMKVTAQIENKIGQNKQIPNIKITLKHHKSNFKVFKEELEQHKSRFKVVKIKQD